MAKKGNRIQVIMECTEHKNSGMAVTSRYITTKNKKKCQDFNSKLIRCYLVELFLTSPKKPIQIIGQK